MTLAALNKWKSSMTDNATILLENPIVSVEEITIEITAEPNEQEDLKQKLYYALSPQDGKWITKDAAGSEALWDYSFEMWFFEHEEKAQISAEWLLKHGIKVDVMQRPSEIVDVLLNGTFQEKKALKARCNYQYDFKKFKTNEENFGIDCEKSGFGAFQIKELPEEHWHVKERKIYDSLRKKYDKLQKEKHELSESLKKCEKLEIEVKELKESGEDRYGDIILRKTGLFYSPENSTDVDGEVWISSAIWPEAYLRDKENKGHTLLLKVYDGEKYHRIALPRNVINKLNDLIAILLDLGQSVSTAQKSQKHLQAFLQRARPDKMMRCVDKSGWHEEQYIFPDGEVIRKERDASESVYPINETCPKGIENKGTPQDWKDNILKIAANNSRLVFSIGASLSAPCLHLSGDEGGVFNFKGTSSIGKTRCLMVAVSVFGSPGFKRSWRTTANGLEAICSLHNDCLLALDEFGQSDTKEVGEIAYMYTQGIGKQRSDRTAQPREIKTWRGMLFSTGEVGISDHMQSDKNKPKAGQLVRVIDIPAQVQNAYGCFEDLHGFVNGKDGEKFADQIKEVCGQYYGTIGREFIKAIVTHGVEKATKYIKFSRDDFAAKVAASYDGQVKRVANRFGLVYAALSLGVELDILSDYLTKEMCEASVTKCFYDWLGDRGTTGSFESHSIVNQVIGLINENSDSKFIPRNETEDKKIRSVLWGYKDGATFYLFSKAFKEICTGHDEKVAKETLVEHGLLLAGKDGKFSQPVRILAHTKSQDRFYVIDLNQEKHGDDDA